MRLVLSGESLAPLSFVLGAILNIGYTSKSMSNGESITLPKCDFLVIGHSGGGSRGVYAVKYQEVQRMDSTGDIAITITVASNVPTITYTGSSSDTFRFHYLTF